MNTECDCRHTHTHTRRSQERMNKINSVFLLLQGEYHVYTWPNSFAILFFGTKSHRVGNDTSSLQFSLKAFKLILAPGGNSHPRWNQVMSTRSSWCDYKPHYDTMRVMEAHPFSRQKSEAYLLWMMTLIFSKRKANSQHFHPSIVKARQGFRWHCLKIKDFVKKHKSQKPNDIHTTASEEPCCLNLRTRWGGFGGWTLVASDEIAVTSQILDTRVSDFSYYFSSKWFLKNKLMLRHS